jgi:hypothetical protein
MTESFKDRLDALYQRFDQPDLKIVSFHTNTVGYIRYGDEIIDPAGRPYFSLWYKDIRIYGDQINYGPYALVAVDTD